jgi:hypothetical protein
MGDTGELGTAGLGTRFQWEKLVSARSTAEVELGELECCTRRRTRFRSSWVGTRHSVLCWEKHSVSSSNR